MSPFLVLSCGIPCSTSKHRCAAVRRSGSTPARFGNTSKAKVCQLQAEALQQGVSHLRSRGPHHSHGSSGTVAHHLTEEGLGPALRQGPPFSTHSQRHPLFSQLHHQVDFPVGRLQHLIHLDDVLVVQGTDNLELPEAGILINSKETKEMGESSPEEPNSLLCLSVFQLLSAHHVWVVGLVPF